MLPARAIVTDVAGDGQENLGNNFIALMVGFGNLISYLFSALVPDPYIWGTIIIIVVALPTLIFAKEKQYKRKEGEKLENPLISTFKTLGKIFKGGPVLRAGFVFLMSWMAYFSFNTSATMYTATVVYNGKADEESALMAMVNSTFDYSLTPSEAENIPFGKRVLLRGVGLIVKAIAKTASPSTISEAGASLNSLSSVSQGGSMKGLQDTLMDGLLLKSCLSIGGAASQFAPTALLIHSGVTLRRNILSTFAENPSLLRFISSNQSSLLSIGCALFGNGKYRYIHSNTPEGDAYKKGVTMGSIAMMVMSLLTSLFSAIADKVQKLFGLKLTYFITQLIATCCLVAMWAPPDMTEKYLWLVFVCFSLMAFNFSQFNSVPFAIVSEAVGAEQAGAYSGAMNIFCLAGQSISQGVAAIVAAAVPTSALHRKQLQWVFFSNAIISFLATATSLLLKSGKAPGSYQRVEDKEPDYIDDRSVSINYVKDDSNEEEAPLVSNAV